MYSAGMSVRLRLFVILAWMSWTLGQDQTANPDINVVGIVGKSIRLPCDIPVSDPPQVEWVDFVHNVGRDPQPIFSSTSTDDGMFNEHVNRIDLDVSSVDYMLTISNLNLESDPGQYICRSVVDDRAYNRSYYLSLMDMPACNGETVLREGSSTQLVCEAKYTGNMIPRVEWTRDSVPVDSVDDFDIALARRRLTLAAVSDGDDQNKYTCEVTIGEKVEQCSVILDVAFLARDMSLTPTKSTLRIGDTVRCGVRGNPVPDVVVSVSGGLETVESGSGTGAGTLEVARSWVGHEVTVSCVAKNTVDGTTQTATESITFNVTEAQSEKQPSQSVATSDVGLTVIIAVVTITTLIVIAAVVACVIVRRRKDLKRPKGAKPLPTKEELMHDHNGVNGGHPQAV